MEHTQQEQHAPQAGHAQCTGQQAHLQETTNLPGPPEMPPAEIPKWLTAAALGLHMSPPAQMHPELLPALQQGTLLAQPHLSVMTEPVQVTLNLPASLDVHPVAAEHAEHARQTEHTG